MPPRRDMLTKRERSERMSLIRAKDTKMEIQIRSLLHRQDYRFRLHAAHLPGKPDIVFVRHKVVVFLDGDFWHGYRFHQWRPKLQLYWRNKIQYNRDRDRKIVRRLRRRGWRVIRIWEHDIKRKPE